MNLLLLPIVVSIFGVILFSIPILVGVGILIPKRTAPLGKRILIYSSLSFLGGLVGCWIGFGLMLLAWPSWSDFLLIHTRTMNLSLPVALGWVSGPIGVVLGAMLARRVLQVKR
jgi:hypothetical protein